MVKMKSKEQGKGKRQLIVHAGKGFLQSVGDYMNKSLKTGFLFVLLFSTIISCTTKTTISNDQINLLDELLTKNFNNEETDLFPGAAVFVSIEGEPVCQKYFGMANIDTSVKISADTTFRIGSITKQFTATAILRLKERGLLELDDTVDKYIPDFPQGESVTIYHLLSHTSGIKSFTAQKDFLDNVVNYIKTEDLIDQIKTLGYDFQPGEKWKYNNSGYFILGYIIEIVSGKSYSEFLNDNIFTPLNMASTGVYMKNLNLPNEAIGYDTSYIVEVQESLNWDMSHAGGAGNIYSNVGDLFLWNEALFNGRVLTEESLNEALTPTILNNGDEVNYGLGWTLVKIYGYKLVLHGGKLNGFHAMFIRLPELNATVIVLTNHYSRFSIGYPLYSIHYEIIQVLFGNAWDK